jgi:hypothetical protein
MQIGAPPDMAEEASLYFRRLSYPEDRSPVAKDAEHSSTA